MPLPRAAAAAGADVTLVSGPVDPARPAGRARRSRVETAREMLAAVEARASRRRRDLRRRRRRLARRADAGAQKIKKSGKARRRSTLVENPDILATIAQRNTQRPQLVIGFAAETENVLANAQGKLAAKGCDWIVANDVSPRDRHHGRRPQHRHLVTAAGVEVLAGAMQGGRARASVARSPTRRRTGRRHA